MSTLRIPNRSIMAAANGPMNPNRIRLIETASEIVARLQPKASCRGTIRIPGAERKPDAPIRTMKVTAAMTQA